MHFILIDARTDARLMLCCFPRALFLMSVRFSTTLGKLSAETLRDQLRTAVREGDRDTLEAVLAECVSAGMPELDSAIQRARSKLQDMEDVPKLGGHCRVVEIIYKPFLMSMMSIDGCLFVGCTRV